jgi:hypothetical protein
MNFRMPFLVVKLSASLLTFLAISNQAMAENRVLDVKTGYCITIQEPTSLAGSWCISQVYYFRESDQNIYICGVSVGGKPPTSAIDKVPSEIGCFPLGKSPITGTITMRSLGDRLNTKEYISSGSLQDSMFSWRGAYWLVADKTDSLAFCVWSNDASSTPTPVSCTDKIDWNKYISSGGVGSQ